VYEIKSDAFLLLPFGEITNGRRALVSKKVLSKGKKRARRCRLSFTSGGSIRIERKSDWSRKHADAALFVDGPCADPLDVCCVCVVVALLDIISSLSLRFSRKKKSVDVFGKKIFFLQKKKKVISNNNVAVSTPNGVPEAHGGVLFFFFVFFSGNQRRRFSERRRRRCFEQRRAIGDVRDG
jgi:hypothetical protein